MHLQTKMCTKSIKGDFDVVVIGSGISGLTCACILGKLGKKVLVLEQHDRPGGCLHTFKENGFCFSSGNHYIGSLDETSKKLISVCGSSFSKSEGEIETFIWNGERKCIRDADSWKNVFQCDQNKITNLADSMWWLALVKLAPNWLAALAWVFVRIWHWRAFAPYRQSVQSKWFQMQEGDVGCQPIAMVGAAVSRHYMEGLSKLSPTFVYDCCKTIKKQNGAVVVKKTVTKLTSKGVHLQGGDFVSAKQIISSVGALHTCTFAEFPLLKNTVQQLGQNTLHKFVFIGLKCSLEEAGLPSGVIWIKAEDDYLFVSTHGEKKVAVHLISETLTYKNMEALFYKYYPKTDQFRVHRSCASHYSVKKYLGRFSSYGLSCRAARFSTYQHVRTLRPDTSKANVFLTGQDILMPGIASALTTAMMTCRQVQKISLIDTILKKDIMDQI